MKNEVKEKVVTITFLVFVFGLFLINILKAPTEISTSERRKLAQFPEVTLEKIGNTKFMSEFASYAVDQFVWRDEFRSIKASFLFDVLKQKDNNGIYIVDGHASKMLAEIKEKELTQTVKNLNKLYSTMLSKSNVYYSIIPDKNYFLAEENGYPHMDYDKFIQIVKSNINKNMEYIDIVGNLSEADYYTTDIHWGQEHLSEVVNTILSAMNEGYDKNTVNNYDIKELYPFYGTYYGQSALPLQADTLKYLTNEEMEKVVVKILDENALAENKVEFKESTMYNTAEFTSIDPYNVYLSGPKALITLENPNANTNKELVIFRDSFGSSLAPLLTSEYSKITLVDLRYIASPLVKNLVTFNKNQDVLIIYSTEVLNNGSILKIM